MEGYNRDSLREEIRELVIGYQTEKAIDRYEKDREGVEKKIFELYKKAAEIMVDEMFKCEGIEVDKKEKEDCVNDVAIQLEEQYFGYGQIEEIIRKNSEDAWMLEEKLEYVKKIIKNLEIEEEIKNAYFSLIEEGKEIGKVKNEIIEELTKIAEKKGIDNLKKNLGDLIPSTIRKILPIPDDYRNLMRKEWEIYEGFEKNMKIIGEDVEEPPYADIIYSKLLEFTKNLYFAQMEREIKKIYGSDAK